MLSINDEGSAKAVAVAGEFSAAVPKNRRSSSSLPLTPLKEHIRIEENYFDGLIANTISPADDVRLVEQFDALDRTWNDRRREGERT